MQAAILLLAIVSLATARTDLKGCVSSEYVKNYAAYYSWWDPNTGEICTFIDCGGGRAAPITTKPGCPGYSGTATYTPSYMPNFNAVLPDSGSGSAASTTHAITTSTKGSAAMITGSQTSSADLQQTITTGSSSNLDAQSSEAKADVTSSEVLASVPITSIASSRSGTANGTVTSKAPAGTTAAVVSSLNGSSGDSKSLNLLVLGVIGGLAVGVTLLL